MSKPHSATSRPEPEPDDGGTPETGRRGGRQAPWIVAAVAICAALALFWPRGESAFDAPGGFLVDAQGRPQPLGEELAPVTLLHFWATWCPPCLEEIPQLIAFSEELVDRPGFRLLLVAVNDDAQQATAFLGGRSSGLLLDPEWAVAHRFGTRQLPDTYIIVDGTVVETFRGATDWSDPSVRRRVLSRLPEPPEESRS